MRGTRVAGAPCMRWAWEAEGMEASAPRACKRGSKGGTGIRTLAAWEQNTWPTFPFLRFYVPEMSMLWIWEF
jgi:hypothetical protein